MRDFFVPREMLLYGDHMEAPKDFVVRGFSAGQAEDEGALTVTVSAQTAGIVCIATLTDWHHATDKTITLPEGIEPGDLVLVFTANTKSTINLTTAIKSDGYTPLCYTYSNSGYDARALAHYKIMGETPDTTVVSMGSGYTGHPVVNIIYVFRGVNQANPIDVSCITAKSNIVNTPVASGIINPISVGAVIVDFCTYGSASVVTLTAPPTLTDVLTLSVDPTLAQSCIAGLGVDTNSQYFGRAVASNDGFASLRVALRPA